MRTDNGTQESRSLPSLWPSRAVLRLLAFLNFLCCSQTRQACSADVPFAGSRVVLDALNCYPYGRRWTDRIDRALSAGTPLAIEQDLAWHIDPQTGAGWSVLSHRKNTGGFERTLKYYFFERVRPIVEQALLNPDRRDWPLITLNLDFKSEEPEHLKAVWRLLREYADWITSAARLPDIRTISSLDVKPILVLTGESQAQEEVFYHQVPEGDRLLVFGATPFNPRDPSAPPEVLAPGPMNNYRRWWNNPWRVIEPEGQNGAGEWSAQGEARLNELVGYAHEHGFWIRFYALNGAPATVERHNGWSHAYNFGLMQSALTRWRAAIRAGVDFLSIDQYEDLARELGRNVAIHPDRASSGSRMLKRRTALRQTEAGHAARNGSLEDH